MYFTHSYSLFYGIPRKCEADYKSPLGRFQYIVFRVNFTYTNQNSLSSSGFCYFSIYFIKYGGYGSGSKG
jgi:hypothetical protein